MAEQTYDVVVIGAGPAGENVAGRAVAGGLTAAVVERELVGGECSYWACMPSKALLRPGEALAAARRVPGAAPAVTGGVDVAATLRSRDEFISGLDDDGQVQWLEGAGVALLRGHGRISGEREVTVTADDGTLTTVIASRAVVIATGSSAAMPPIDGLVDAAPWDNRDATTATEVPGHLLVLGGGVVGVEMAQAWRRLGAHVTVIEARDRLLATEEPFVGDQLAAALTADGVDVRLGATTTAVHRGDNGEISMELDDGGSVTGDELLVAVGRRPNSGDVGVDKLGLEPGRSIPVDDHLHVDGTDWLFAVGDVNGRNLLTHMGKYQARLVADQLLGHDVTAWADHRATPRVVFTDPRVAAVGHTEASAREAGLTVRTATTRRPGWPGPH